MQVVSLFFVEIIIKNRIVIIQNLIYTLLLRACHIKKVLFLEDLVFTFVTYILLTGRCG